VDEQSLVELGVTPESKVSDFPIRLERKRVFALLLGVQLKQQGKLDKAFAH
jgi:hypothetical protein